MKKFIVRFRDAYFAPHFDLRVRLFHVLAIGGTIISLLMAISGIITHSGFVNVIVNMGTGVLSYALLTYSRLTRRYEVCYIITIVIIFMGLFPVLFFSAGGYHSGMPTFFVFAVAFTVFMLEGKKAIFFSLVELMLYTVICLVAYNYPETVNAFAEEREILIDIILAFIAVSAILGSSLFLHLRLYNEQQKKLDEQNTVLAHASRAKTDAQTPGLHSCRSSDPDRGKNTP